MERLSNLTGADLKPRSLAFLQENFGKTGAWCYRIARGIDERPVQPDRPRKSVGAEDTFAVDIFGLEAARRELAPLIEKVWRYCQDRAIRGRIVTLKVKFSDFQQITPSRTAHSIIDRQGVRADQRSASRSVLSGREGRPPAWHHRLKSRGQ